MDMKNNKGWFLPAFFFFKVYYGNNHLILSIGM